MKYVSLVLLTAHNAFITLLIRYILVRDGERFLQSTIVPLTELTKLLCCLIVLFIQADCNWSQFLHHINRNVIQQPLDCLRITIPSFVYTLQNNLQYVAMGNLEAATFQVTYQLKILTTAMFSVILLRKRLGVLQWVALILLFIGVSLVQLQPQNTKLSTTVAPQQNPLLGITAALGCSLMSGFAGVYFETLLKSSTRRGSLWTWNVHMCISGLVFSALVTHVNDGEKIRENGFFYGYDWLVWLAMFMQAFGGLIVALVVKYADNILKGFASSGAIIVSCVASIYIFHFVPSVQFVMGTALVITSICLYSKR